MKKEFDFPLFSDLRLGPIGKVHGKGCLATKINEVQRNAGMTLLQCARFGDAVDEELGGSEEWMRLSDPICPNTYRNRRKAYDALVRATEKFCNVTIS